MLTLFLVSFSTGYNDGLHASDAGSGGVQSRLTEKFASSIDFDPLELKEVDRSLFDEQLGMAGSELLTADVKRLIDDANRLEPIFLNQAGGQE